jgi:hypothetical protein
MDRAVGPDPRETQIKIQSNKPPTSLLHDEVLHTAVILA